jgi:hypothetical protein
VGVGAEVVAAVGAEVGAAVGAEVGEAGVTVRVVAPLVMPSAPAVGGRAGDATPRHRQCDKKPPGSLEALQRKRCSKGNPHLLAAYRHHPYPHLQPQHAKHDSCYRLNQCWLQPGPVETRSATSVYVCMYLYD